MRTLRAAVVGTGFIGPVHVEAVRRLGHVVVGLLGSSPTKSAAAAAALRIPRAYATYSELLADPQVDVVHLASPNRVHFEQAREAIAAGKHVIVEKPLAMTTAETAELVRLAAQAKVITAVNYNVRFYPMVLEARARVQNGSIGRIFHVNGSYLQDWLLYPTDYNWRVDSESGGKLRAIADIGTHWLDTIAFITGLQIEAVCADLATVHPERLRPVGGRETFASTAASQTEPVPIDTEDYGSVLVKFAGGARGVFTVSQVTAGRKNSIRFDIAGSAAALAWESDEPNTLHMGRRGAANERIERDPGLMDTAMRGFSDYPGGHAEGFPDTFKMLFRAIYADILAGSHSAGNIYATFADGHSEVAICEAILASAATGQWVSVQR
ncbi:MAG: Gfo/Idh/MocA family protein [Gemmataceae bacterium]